MSERTGTCLDCGQRYSDIPDSVTATRVKCSVCQGTVEIPPLAAPAPPAATPEVPKAPPAPTPAAPLGAKPLGKEPKKAERPASAQPVDRDVTKPAAKAPMAPITPASSSKGPVPSKQGAKGNAPARPVFTPKRGGVAGKAPAKPVAPKRPVAPVSKAAPPKKPVAPVSKAAPIKKPVAPVSKAAPPVKKVAKPVAPAAAKPSNDDSAKKAKAADIIAKAKAKRAAQGSQPGSDSGASKASGADLIAKLKAKKEGQGAETKKAAPAKAAVAPAAKKPARKKASSGARKGSTKRAGSGRRDREEEAEGGRRHHAPQKSGPPVAMIVVSLVGLAAIAGGWFWWQGQQEEPTEVVAAQTNSTANAAPVVDDAPTQAAQPLDIAAGDSTEADSSADTGSGSTDDTKTDEASSASTEAAAPVKAIGPGADFNPPAPGEAVDTRGITDFHVLDLSLIPPIAKWDQCSEEDWASVQEDIALFLDDSGIQSTRAGDRLVGLGRTAYPAAVNALLAVDFSTKDGAFTATTLNDLLYKITNSNRNFGWNNVAIFEEGSDDFLKNALFNKKIAATWQKYWYLQDWANNEKSWNAFCGLDKEAETTDEPVAGDAGDDFFDD